MAYKDKEKERVNNTLRQKRRRTLNINNPRPFLLRLLCETKKRAKKKGMDYDLDLAWAVNQYNGGSCSHSGMPYASGDGEGMKAPFHPSIDRIDNSRGYTKDNCRMMCWCVNNAMADYNDTVFWTWVTSANAHVPDEYKPSTESVGCY